MRGTHRSVVHPENRAAVAGITFALEGRRAVERTLIGDEASRRVGAGGAELSGAESIDPRLCPTVTAARQPKNRATIVNKAAPLVAAAWASGSRSAIFRR